MIFSTGMIKIFTRAICVFTLCLLIYRWIRHFSNSTLKYVNDSNQSSRLANKPKRNNLRARRIFISHSWHLSSHDYKLLLKNLRNIRKIYNHSIPRKNARHFRDAEDLHDIFRRQILWCSKVFVLADKELPLDSYVLTEMEIAAELGKEIIAIQPNPLHSVPPFIRRRAHHIISNDAREIKRILEK